jgi:outer membrane protein
MEHQSQTNRPSASFEFLRWACGHKGSHRAELIPPLLCGLFLLTCSLHIAAQESPPPLLTEEQAVSIALGANRDIQNSKLSILQANAALREARTNYYPQTNLDVVAGSAVKPLQLTIPAGALGTYPTIGPVPDKTAVIGGGSGMESATLITVAQPIAQLYKTHLGVESALVSQRLSAANDLGERQQVVAQVKEEYHQVAAAQAAVDSDAAQLSWLEEALRVTRTDLEQGTALKADELQAESSLEQQKLNTLHDQDNLITQREQLNHLLGRDIDTQFSVETVPPPTSLEADLSAARAAALQHRPEIRQADLQAQKAVLDERTDRAGYIPNVNAQLTYIGLENVRFMSPNSVTVGFSVQWKNPWDWGHRKADIEGLKDVTKQQGITADDTRQKILLDVDQKYRTLQEALATVNSAALARDASAESLRTLTNQYREKTALLQDLLKQNADLEQRKASYAQAIQNYWSSRADFDRAIGDM